MSLLLDIWLKESLCDFKLKVFAVEKSSSVKGDFRSFKFQFVSSIENLEENDEEEGFRIH